MTDKKKRFKAGLALGSGGAKGMAELGALKAFREKGIEFDFYAGTSIGSLIGALLAKGLTDEDIVNITDEMMKNSPFSLVGVFGGDLVSEVNGILGGAGFSDLKKPFCATAADMTSGEEVAFFGGDLAIAVAASCAIPPAFAPVCADGRKLVDGAFLNSVPSDRCVELGAEVVIGIDLGKGGSNRYMKAVLDDLYPENRIPLADKNSKGREYSSFMLRPALDAYRGISVCRLNEMFDIGYECALANMDEVISALDGNFKVFGDTERQEILRRKAIRYGRGA